MLFRIKRKASFIRKLSFGKPEKYIAAPFNSIYKMSEILGKTPKDVAQIHARYCREN